MKEIWKTLSFTNDYSVSNLGRVRRNESRKRRKDGSIGHVKQKVLKTHVNTNGYPQANLSVNGKRISILIHRLVVDTFIQPILGSSTLMTVDHINGIRTDNRVDNLRFITHRDNIINSKTKRDLPVGVYESNVKNGRKYYSMIKISGKTKHLGSYKTIKGAEGAYKREKAKLEKRLRLNLREDI